MASSQTESSYRGLKVFFLPNLSHEPPVPWENWAQRFQLVVILKEAIDVENFLTEKALPENVYPTLNKPAGTK